MKAIPFSLVLGFAMAGCIFGKAPTHPAASERDSGASEWQKPAVPYEEREKHLAERFPGVHALDFVQFLVWPEPREGACWSEISPPEKTVVSADYRGSWMRHGRSTGLAALAEDGWRSIYRAPLGFGLEREWSFRAVDLTVESELRCRCAPYGSIVEGDVRPMRLRFRWSKGGHPEVSGRVQVKGRSEGLMAIKTYGRLLSFDFPVRGSFPGGAPGTCGAHLGLTILVDPPVL